MTITIPDAVITALVNTGLFLVLVAVAIVIIAMIGGYFYDKEMRKTDNHKAKRTRKPTNRLNSPVPGIDK